MSLFIKIDDLGLAATESNAGIMNNMFVMPSPQTNNNVQLVMLFFD